MVDAGSNIILKRLIFTEEFKEYLENSFEEITKGLSSPSLIYNCDLFEHSIDSLDRTYLSGIFKNRLEHVREKEIRRGYSLTGPNRDDWKFRIKKSDYEFELKQFASQGEQKTYVIALKFAEYYYLNSKLKGSTIGEPILILDDIFSELDSKRVEQTSKIIKNFNQVFLTTTNFGYFQTLQNHFEPKKITAIKIDEGNTTYIY